MRLAWRKSVTLQLTIYFASASAMVLLLLGVFIAHSVEQHFVSLDLEALSSQLRFARNAVEGITTTADLDAFSDQMNNSLIGHQGLSVVIADSAKNVLYASSGATFPNALLDDKGSHESAAPTDPITWGEGTTKPYRGISARTTTGIPGHPPVVVAVAIDISVHEHYKQSFRLTLWSFVVLAAIMTGVFGWVAARRGLAPFRAIRQKAADITAQRLYTRLPVDSVPVELRGLVDTLNDMLARLEHSFKQLSDFSSDIAHELRTPVSNLLTQTQVTLSKNRSADEYRDVLASNVEELERLSRMISDMLFLAKSDNRLMVPHLERLDLREEVNGLIEFYEALAEEKSITLKCTGNGIISGDRLMLRRAISNLLSNALRYTPEGGHIAIELDDTTDSSLTLAVENSGDAIPAEHLPRLFDRFYRVDASRQRFSEGAGLGLAITRSILRAHGGDVYVRSNEIATTFELRLPR